MFLQQLPLRKNTRKWEYSLAWNWNSANINSKYRLVSDWLVRQLVWFISMVPRGGFLNQQGLLLLMLRSWYMLISFMLMLLGVVFVFIRSKTSSGFVELWGHKVNRQHSQSHVFSPALTGVDFARCHLIFPRAIEELILSRFPPPKLLLGFMIVRHISNCHVLCPSSR